MASNVTNAGARQLADRSIDWVNDTIKAMLLTAAYTPNKDHDFVDDIVAQECSGTGYANGFGQAGRKALTGKSFTTDTANDRVRYNGTIPAWPGINLGTEPRYIALIKEITNDGASPVIAILDLGTVDTNGTEMTATQGADGLFYLQQ